MGILKEGVKEALEAMEPGYLTRTPEAVLMAKLQIDYFGIAKCRKVMEYYGSLENLFTAPVIMVRGMGALTIQAQDTLMEFLNDPDVKAMAAAYIFRIELARSLRPKDARQPEMKGFRFKRVLDHLLGYQTRGRAPTFILDRWMRGPCLKECIMQRRMLGHGITDHVHWDIMRAMHCTNRQAIALSLNDYRNAFSGEL